MDFHILQCNDKCRHFAVSKDLVWNILRLKQLQWQLWMHCNSKGLHREHIKAQIAAHQTDCEIAVHHAHDSSPVHHVMIGWITLYVSAVGKI